MAYNGHRLALGRDFYMPHDRTLTPVDCAGTDAAIYTFERAGAPYAIGFHGKAAKPDFHLRFRSPESRADYIAKYLEGRKARASVMAERKVKRSTPHSLKPGDILSASWGYDQTNRDYYQVVATTEKTVTVRAIAAETVSSAAGGIDHVAPTRGRFLEGKDGEPRVHKVNGETNSIKVRAWGVWASKWSGAPEYQTALGWGH